MSNTIGEHRQHPRARLLLPVRVQTGQGPTVFAVATDVSVGGVFLLEDARVSRAQSAQLEVVLDSAHTVRVYARVVRKFHDDEAGTTDLPGVALQFIGLDRSSAMAIAQLVHDRSAA